MPVDINRKSAKLYCDGIYTADGTSYQNTAVPAFMLFLVQKTDQPESSLEYRHYNQPDSEIIVLW